MKNPDGSEMTDAEYDAWMLEVDKSWAEHCNAREFTGPMIIDGCEQASHQWGEWTADGPAEAAVAKRRCVWCGNTERRYVAERPAQVLNPEAIGEPDQMPIVEVSREMLLAMNACACGGLNGHHTDRHTVPQLWTCVSCGCVTKEPVALDQLLSRDPDAGGWFWDVCDDDPTELLCGECS